MADDDVKPFDEIDPEYAVERARQDAPGIAQFRSGLGVPHAEVVEWVRSWDTERELPRPKPHEIR